jgi:transcriptional regulator with XRE-family HTH domain
MTNAKVLGGQIRRILKQRGLSQSDFALALRISLPTLKRWLGGSGCSLQDWLRMLNALNLNLAEAAHLAERELSQQFSYTLTQEQVLAKEEGLLAFFDALLRRKTVAQISRQHSLSERAIIYYLSKLEKLNLIEWLPKNKVKLLVSGEPRWIKGGPLSKKFRRSVIDLHLANHSDDPDLLRVAIYSLSKESSQKVQFMISETIEKIRMLEVMDQAATESKKMITVILGVGFDEPKFLREIPNR